MSDTGIGPLNPLLRVVLGFLAGVAIGAVSTLLRVAGGELIIPTIVLLFAADIKVAGSLAAVLEDRAFTVWMICGSICGSLIGSYLLRHAGNLYLHFFLGAILLICAAKIASHPHGNKKSNMPLEYGPRRANFDLGRLGDCFEYPVA